MISNGDVRWCKWSYHVLKKSVRKSLMKIQLQNPNSFPWYHLVRVFSLGIKTKRIIVTYVTPASFKRTPNSINIDSEFCEIIVTNFVSLSRAPVEVNRGQGGKGRGGEEFACFLPLVRFSSSRLGTGFAKTVKYYSILGCVLPLL